MSLIEREALLAEYDRVHVGPPGGARKLIEDALEVPPKAVAEIKIDNDALQRMVDIETLDQYQKSLDEDAHWLTEYAQGKGPKDRQPLINITVTMHRAAWALRELMKERLADDSGSYDALLPSAQPEIIRCKDCKHWDGVDTCDVIDAPVWDNDFCSMAERRSDE